MSAVASILLLDDFVSVCRRLCDDQCFEEAAVLAKSHVAPLGQAPNLPRIDPAFEALASTKYTIVMVGLVAMKFNAQPSAVARDWKQLGAQVQTLVAITNVEHVFHVRELFNAVLHEMTKTFLAAGVPATGIPVLEAAIRQSQSDLRFVSTLHADLFQLCLAAQVFKPALPFLDVDPVDLVVTENGRFEALRFLLYCYYGGLIYCALKRFKRAAFFFEAAATCPSMTVSAVMIESHKKLVLLSLLNEGKHVTLPKYTSHSATRAFTVQGCPYRELADLYLANKVPLFLSAMQQNRSMFSADENYGLVCQVRESLIRRNIQRLTKVFMTVSLADVARRAHLADAKTAETYLVEMMVRGDIHGSIDQETGMVCFHDYAERVDKSGFDEQLSAGMRREMQTLSLLSAMDHQIEASASFLKRKLDGNNAPARLTLDRFTMDTGVYEKDEEDFLGI